jgi:hypothetical protein
MTEEQIDALKSLIDKVIFELEMSQFLIDDPTESHNIQKKADDYYQQYLNILHTQDQ